MSVIFIFLCVMVVTTVLFGGWVIMSTFKFIGRMLFGGQRPQQMNMSSRGCTNPGCQTINPAHASYCRRCGANLNETAGNPRQMLHRGPQYNPTNGTSRQVAQA